jgi:predicted Zn-dependent protease
MIFALLFILACSAAQGADLRDAVAALQRGDFASAEQRLRTEIAARPDDAIALSLLGVALDGEKKAADAEVYHRRAVAAAPRNPDVLNNYGNHLAAAGDMEGARQAYLKAIAEAPDNVNANLQLVRLALQRKNAAEAIGYLAHVPEAAIGPDVSFSLGMGFGAAGEFAQAENYFTRALAASPNDFNILVDLGIMAASAGHYARAHDVFEAALGQQPENVDLLCRLAAVDFAQRQTDGAVKRLALAARLAPNRADVQKLLAEATTDLGALDDAMAAWGRYLKLAPGDDAARRERAFTAVRMGQVERGAAELREYLVKHPDDAAGHYELGVAAQDSAELDRAIALRSDFAAALSARGGLAYQQGKPELAVKDLESAENLAPDSALTLDRLGQTYSALDRPADAVRVLRRAAELSPDDSKIQLHLARALGDAGKPEESKAAMERFRQLGPTPKNGVPAGLVDYLSLTPDQQNADYRARVEKAYRETPTDPTAQLHHLKLLLEDGKFAEAAPVARKLAGSKDAAEAGRALVDAGQYALAKELLEHSAGPELAIAELHVLEAAGKIDEAAALASSGPKTVEFEWHAAAFLVRHRRFAEAAGLFDAAPDNREALLMRAAVLSAAGKGDEADRIVSSLRRRWPEWPPGWKPLADALSKPPREW